MLEEPGALAPRISVVMPAFNAAAHVGAAVESILGQTYGDFELVVIDDGSTDGTAEIVGRHADPRIRLLRNPRNLGLIATLNRGLRECRGELVARMDADDISLPGRFAAQLRFLDAHPEVGICGTSIETFGARTERWTIVCDPALLRAEMLFSSAFSHPTVMFRRALLLRHGLAYDPAYPHAEDYALWARFAAVTELANLPEVLLRYRLHGESVSERHHPLQQATADRIRREQLRRLGLEASDRQLALHRTLMRGAPHTLALDVAEAEGWMATLIAANRRAGYCDQGALSELLYEKWFKLCRAHRRHLYAAGLRFLDSPLSRGMPLVNRLADGARLLMPRRAA